ncbi:hypothetical protein KI387_011997, partial [Taxus chinensis]
PLDPDWVAERPADDTVDDAGCTGAYMVWWAGQRAARVAQPAQPDLAAMTAERDQLRGQVQLLQGQLSCCTGTDRGLTGAASPGSGTGTGSTTTSSTATSA